MVEAATLKNGVTFEYQGLPHQVIKYEHQKIARGSGTVKLNARNLSTGELVNLTAKPGHKFEKAETVKKKLRFLYLSGGSAFFMDDGSFEQVEISTDTLGDKVKYIKEGEEANILFWRERPLTVEIAPKVVLEVTEAPPGIKGNSADNVYKSVTLENGLVIRAPLFIKAGDKLKIDTRTGEYAERA